MLGLWESLLYRRESHEAPEDPHIARRGHLRLTLPESHLSAWPFTNNPIFLAVTKNKILANATLLLGVQKALAVNSGSVTFPRICRGGSLR